MKKNVSGQAVGAQLITASDGSAFTGAVTVSVTGDAGTQATGSVGSGACTHEGNGYHTYAPAQAETNYDLVAYTFTGSGAIPTTVQIYTTFPQTGDNFTRIGAPVGASISADIAAKPVATDIVSGGAITTSGGAVSNVTLVATTTTNTDMRGTDGANTITPLDAAGIRTAVGLASPNMDTQFTASATATGFSTHSAADVWSVATRVLTAGTNLNDFNPASDRVLLDKTDAMRIAAAVNDASATTTSFVTDLTEATDDHYIGRTVIFTSGALEGQATDITDYNGTTKALTVTALTEAPADNDTFEIV